MHFFIEIEDVSITDLTFGNEFAAAIESKQVAQQDAERAKFVVDKVCACFCDREARFSCRVINRTSVIGICPALSDALFAPASVTSHSRTSHVLSHSWFWWSCAHTRTQAAQDAKSVVIKAQGEAESAQLIGNALAKNPGFLELRRLGACAARSTIIP